MGANSTVSGAEIGHFDALARQWWDEDGDFRALHRINPARIQFIRDQIQAHFGIEAGARAPLKGLSILDIGCGGGLIAEPMARLGAEVTAIDVGADAIEAARLHAGQSGLEIGYRCISAEQLAAEDMRFDDVLTLEVARAALFTENAMAMPSPRAAATAR